MTTVADQGTEQAVLQRCHGHFVAVDADTKAVTVNGENVEGWMGPMIMKYKFVHVKKSEDEDLRNELHIGHTLLTD